MDATGLVIPFGCIILKREDGYTYIHLYYSRYKSSVAAAAAGLSAVSKC